MTAGRARGASLGLVAAGLLAGTGCGASDAERAALRDCLRTWNSQGTNFNGHVLAGGYVRQLGVEEAIVFRFAGGECGVAFELPASRAIEMVWANPRDRSWNYWGALTGRLPPGTLRTLPERVDTNATMLRDGRMLPLDDSGIEAVKLRLGPA